MADTANTTKKLGLLLIDPNWQFSDESFNHFILDADDKLVGKSHIQDASHWELWKPNTSYTVGDVIRYTNLKSSQCAYCIASGESNTKEPSDNVTGSIITTGTAKFQVMDILKGQSQEGMILTWLSGEHYERGVVAYYNKGIYRCTRPHDSTTFEENKNNWQEIYASIRIFTNDFYNIGDSVIYDGLIYQCTEAHTATSFDDSKWKLISGVGGANEWQVNKRYQVGQFVIYKDILYRCNAKHTSNTTDFQTDIAKWDIVYANIPNWASGVYYKAGTIIKYDNLFFINSAGHTSSSNFETDRSKWMLLSNVLANLQAWVANKYYYEGQCIVNGNTIYRCKTAHTSATDWDNDNADWETIGGGTLNTWTAATMYLKDDIVIHNNKLYQCLLAHKANNDFNHDYKNEYWQEISKTQIDDWTSSTHYYIGDLVLKDAQIYKCIKNNDSSTDFKVDYETDGDWELVSPTVDEITDWTANKEYKKDQLVLHNNLLYRCKVLHTSATDFDTDYNSDDWVQLCSATILDWETPHKYEIGDIIRYENNLYMCVKLHTSTSFNADVDNWQLIGTINIASTWTKQTLYLKDQIVYYNNVPYKAKETHISGNDFATNEAEWLHTFSNVQLYKKGIYYKVGDTVISNNKLYRCKVAHTSVSEDVEQTTLNTKDEFFVTTYYGDAPIGSYEYITIDASDVYDLGSIKPVSNIYAYFDNDSAAYCNLYIYVSDDGTNYSKLYETQNELSGNFNLKVTLNTRYIKFVSNREKRSYASNGSYNKVKPLIISVNDGYWQVIGDVSDLNISNWTANKVYEKNILVYYNGALYVCNSVHISTSIFEPQYWDRFDGKHDNWAKDTRYFVNDVIIYNGTLYRCIKEHTSENTFKDDIDNWELLSNVQEWKSGNTYTEGQLVLHDGAIYRSIKQNNDTSFSKNNFELAVYDTKIQPITNEFIDTLFEGV